MNYIKNVRIFVVMVSVLIPALGKAMQQRPQQLTIGQRFERIERQVAWVEQSTQIPVKQRLDVLQAARKDYVKMVQNSVETQILVLSSEYGLRYGQLAQKMAQLLERYEKEISNQEADDKTTAATLHDQETKEREHRAREREEQEQRDRQLAMHVADHHYAHLVDEDAHLNAALAPSITDQPGEVLMPAAQAPAVRMASPEDMRAIAELERREAQRARAIAPAPAQQRAQVQRFPGNAMSLQQNPPAPAVAAVARRVPAEGDIVLLDNPEIPQTHVTIPPAAPTVSHWFTRNMPRMIAVAVVAAVVTWWFLKK